MSLKNLIISVCNHLHRPNEEVDSILTNLEDNWIIEITSFLNINENQWSLMKLPIKLINLHGNDATQSQRALD